MESLSLLELQTRIKGVLDSGFACPVWVRAEVSEVKVNYNGHCYMSLIEKGEDGYVKARAQGVVWASVYRNLAPFFRSAAGTDIASGMNLLLKVQVQFSSVYGLSLMVTDIDPSFTIGEMEMSRRRTLERLKKEGVIDMNRGLELPVMPKRLAVISSPTAAGYEDFMKHLEHNDYGFRFTTVLFQAQMQGDGAPASMIAALDRISAYMDQFDAVLIMRGGGSVSDLACFDDYDLAFYITQFPLPVLTAVGHERDRHVCDEVANVSVKTPTALADFMVSLLADEDAMLCSLASSIYRSAREMFVLQDEMLERIGKQVAKYYTLSVKGYFADSVKLLNELELKMRSSIRLMISEENGRLDRFELIIRSNDLTEVLNRGYATVGRGKERLSSVHEVKTGDELAICMKDGVLKCRVNEIID